MYDSRLKDLRNAMRPLALAMHGSYYHKEDLPAHEARKRRWVSDHLFPLGFGSLAMVRNQDCDGLIE
jgi:hypothetical protein